MAKQATQNKPTNSLATHKVVKEFRDKDNFDFVFKVGEDVSHLDKDRLNRLIELKLVEKS